MQIFVTPINAHTFVYIHGQALLDIFTLTCAFVMYICCNAFAVPYLHNRGYARHLWETLGRGRRIQTYVCDFMAMF